MILADTSVWIEHLRSKLPRMDARLHAGEITMHPLIVAELALGSLHDRAKLLAQLDGLIQVSVAQLRDVRSMIEAHSLYSKGLGLVDAHLLASCLLSPGTELWTRDTALHSVAQGIGIHADMP